MFRTAIRQAAQKTSSKSELPQAFVKLPHISPALLSQYPAKKTWPPDFKAMSPQEQLRYEKRYKRKIHHIAQRPKWNKMVQLAQLGTISFVLIYCVFFADWKDERQPFYEFREWFWNSLGFDYEAPNRPVPKIRSEESQASVQGGSRPRQM
ncbi:hypothetical protein QBC45DRAFT_446579 [Copromyces sp. CBS 386.78]|nr:hypothetical protein QBC45DRAFT_446579 [Copromyces sp. CBS 386.78]